MTDIACYPASVRGFALRSTRLDNCGVPLDSTVAQSRITTKGFSSITWDYDYIDGGEIIGENADGDVCVQDRDEPRLKGLKGKAKFCGIPLTSLEMLLGINLLETGGEIRGGVLPAMNRGEVDPIGLEVWTRSSRKGVCSNGNAGSGHPYWHFTFPMTTEWKFASGQAIATNSAMEFELEFYAQSNPNWQPSFIGELPDPTWIDEFQQGGPLGWFDTDTLPTVDVACYDPAA